MTQYDNFGFPKHDGFEGPVKSYRPQVSGRRLLLMSFVVIAAGLFAVSYEHLPGLLKNLERQLLGMRRANPDAAISQKIDLHLRNRDFPAAKRECDRLIKVNPAWGHWRRANVLGEMKEYAASVEDYSQLLLLIQRNPVVRDLGWLATIHNNRAYNRALGRFDLQQALQDAETALQLLEKHDTPERETSRIAFLDTRGFLHYLTGRPKLALADLNRALAQPEDLVADASVFGEIYYHRGLVFQQLNEPDAAARDFAKAKELGYQWSEEILPVAHEPGKAI